jgi:hypothetical protein
MAGLEAAELIGLKRISAIKLHGLSEAQKRALLIADNKIAETAGWDRERKTRDWVAGLAGFELRLKLKRPRRRSSGSNILTKLES